MAATKTLLKYDGYTLDSTDYASGAGNLRHLSCAPIEITVDGKNVDVEVEFVGWETVDLPYGGRLRMIDKFPPFQDYKVKKVVIFKPSNGPPIIHTWYISHHKHMSRILPTCCNIEHKDYDPEKAVKAYEEWLVHKMIPLEIEKECKAERIRYGHEKESEVIDLCNEPEKD